MPAMIPVDRGLLRGFRDAQEQNIEQGPHEMGSHQSGLSMQNKNETVFFLCHKNRSVA